MNSYKTLIVTITLIFVSLIPGCQKTPINGNLDGEWEVMEVITENVKPEPSDRYFYNFSRHVCQLTLFGYPFTNGSLIYDGDIMTLNFPFVVSTSEKDLLKQYGIFTNPVSFDVKFEGKSRLILSNDETLIILKKF